MLHNYTKVGVLCHNLLDSKFNAWNLTFVLIDIYLYFYKLTKFRFVIAQYSYG